MRIKERRPHLNKYKTRVSYVNVGLHKYSQPVALNKNSVRDKIRQERRRLATYRLYVLRILCVLSVFRTRGISSFDTVDIPVFQVFWGSEKRVLLVLVAVDDRWGALDQGDWWAYGGS